jgi:hypothetical protein
MAKISDFLNTEQRVAIQNNSYGQEAVKQLADQSTQAEGAYVNNQLQQASREKANARTQAMQAAQIKASEKYQLQNIYGNLQEVQLKTIQTLSAIDEANRQQQEKSMASTYLLNTEVDYALKAKQKMKEIVNNSKPDGSDIMEQFNNWHNEYNIEAEKNAPNALAISSLKNLNAKNMIEFGGMAIDAADNKRTQYVINGINSVINTKVDEASMSPDSFNPTAEMQSIRAILETSNINPSVIDKVLANAASNFYASQIDGFVNNLEFDKAKGLLITDGAKELLSPEQRAKQFDNITKTHIEYYKTSFKQQEVSEALIKFDEGNLSPAEGSKLSSEAKDMLANAITDRMNNILSADVDRSAKATELTRLLKSNAYLPPNVYTDINSKLQVGSTQERVILSNVIQQVFKDKEAKHLVDQIDKELFAEAMVISNYSRTLKDEDAITTTQALTRAPSVVKDLKPISDELLNLTANDIASDAGIISETYGTFFDPDIDVDFAPDLVREYNDMATLAYKKTGDIKKAKEIASTYVSGLFSTSEINGVPEVMEIAPEKAYYGEELDYFNTRLDEVLNELATTNGWTLSEDKRSYTYKDGDLEKTAPLKIMPINGFTAGQFKSNSPTLTWMVVDGRFGKEFESFNTFEVNLEEKRNRDREVLRERLLLEQDQISKLEQINKQFKNGVIKSKERDAVYFSADLIPTE